MRAITASSKSVYRCLPGTPTVFHTRAPKWSAARIFAAMSAPRLRPLPSSRHLAPPSGPSQQCLPGTPTVFHTRAPKWSAARVFAAMSAPRLRPLPSSRHLAPPSGPSQHPSIVVTEPPCSLLDALATSAPFFAPARRIRPFLSPTPLPPTAHHARCAALRYVFSSMCSSSIPVPPPSPPPTAHHARCAALRYVFSSMCSSSIPVPPPSPSRGVYSSVILFLRHLITSAVDLPLRVAARRVLRLYALLTTSLC